MGGRDKHNTKFSCGAFCGAKYEIRRRRKRGRGGHSFSPHPFFCPPRPSVQFGARSAPSVPIKEGSRIFKQRAPNVGSNHILILGKENFLIQYENPEKALKYGLFLLRLTRIHRYASMYVRAWLSDTCVHSRTTIARRPKIPVCPGTS